MILTFLFVVLTLVLQSAARQRQSKLSSADLSIHVEKLVAPHVEAGLLSGAILIAQGEQILFERGFGFAGWELGVPNSQTTRFGIGSLTKLMTEIVVDILVRSGKVDLETPVERYINGFPRGPDGGVPVLRHLLDHRSGVPHRVTSDFDETQALFPSDIVALVKSRGLLFEPGTQRLYSSAGFSCLARVIEIIEKKPFDVVLAERIFGPAGMTTAVDETGQRLMPGRAMPYRLGTYERTVVVKKAPFKDLRFLTGAGSVFGSARDLLSLVVALRKGMFGTELWGRTFGVDSATWQGYYGRTNGYEASVDVLPGRNLVFLFLSNLQSASNWQTREQIRNILAGGDLHPIPLPPPVAETFEDPESLVGMFGPAEIFFVDNQLFRGDNEFYPIEGRRYYIPGSGTIMRFRRSSTNVVDAVISVSPGGRESVLERSASR